MKFAYSTSVFRLRPLNEAIDGIARAGFTAVELIADRPHASPEDMTAAKVTELSNCLSEKKLKVCNLNSALLATFGEQSHPSWIAEDWRDRERRAQYTLQCLRMAAAMGIRNVSTDMGAGPIPESLSLSEALDLYCGQMERILPLAGKLSVNLLLQPEPYALIQSTEDTIEMLERLKRFEHVGIYFDAGHFYCLGEDPCQAYELLRRYIHHVGLSDVPSNRAHRHLQLGEGSMDICKFLSYLESTDYSGYVTLKIDYFDQRAEEVVLGSARYLREHGFMS